MATINEETLRYSEKFGKDEVKVDCEYGFINDDGNVFLKLRTMNPESKTKNSSQNISIPKSVLIRLIDEAYSRGMIESTDVSQENARKPPAARQYLPGGLTYFFLFVLLYMFASSVHHVVGWRAVVVMGLLLLFLFLSLFHMARWLVKWARGKERWSWKDFLLFLTLLLVWLCIC